MAYWTGRHLSEEHRAKIGASLGNTREQRSRRFKGRTLSAEHRKNISDGMSNSPLRFRPKDEQWRKKISLSKTGQKLSEEHRRKIAEGLKRAIKEGRRVIRAKSDSELNHLIARMRWNTRYLQWRQSCLMRDGFACKKCGNTDASCLEVHHKKSLAKLIRDAISCMPLLSGYDACILYSPMWDTNNGVTLCIECHAKTDSFGKNFVTAGAATTQKATLGA